MAEENSWMVHPNELFEVNEGVTVYLACVRNGRICQLSDRYHSITPTEKPNEYVGIKGAAVRRFRVPWVGE
ncbi:MAG: hypothetical protein HY517_02465 [Candidatus Aenigmarchaeota archaeon]|nr:hypothetical protein [Candidatus Aenigmarchaeota archaeon]